MSDKKDKKDKKEKKDKVVETSTETVGDMIQPENSAPKIDTSKYEFVLYATTFLLV
jgi:hypothetical protein